MPASIPGPIAAELLERLRQEHGVRYADAARHCGLRKQNITDLRAGRRRFTRKMADRLLAACRNEPWHEWLEPLLKYHFSQSGNAADDPEYSASIPVESDRPPVAGLPKLPLLTAPFHGDPLLSPTFAGAYIELSRAATELAEGGNNAYVLALPCDDHARRLRAGDQVLIIQTPNTSAEIHVVERRGLLRLTRQAKTIKALGILLEGEVADEVWVALDSGEPISGARSVGYVAGIVWAKL